MNETNGGRTDSVGTLRISKEVLAAIAATAASEVAGVHSLTAPPVHFKGVLSRRKFPKSVSVNLQDDTAEIELRLVIGRCV